MDCKKVFDKIVSQTEQYLLDNNLKAMILGISGGIDSTIVAAICHEVSKRTNIPLYGRSLPTKFNKEDEVNSADLVGKAFCNDYKVVNINKIYNTYLTEIVSSETGEANHKLDEDECVNILSNEYSQTKIANGNIQARLRMIYLYNLASIHGGVVMDTDNFTEHFLGYFTLHGDQGDVNPIGHLWKTEVFELAQWIYSHYLNGVYKSDRLKAEAVCQSMNLIPTAGLGITNSDLEEIGARSYDEVDNILKFIISFDVLLKNDYFRNEYAAKKWYTAELEKRNKQFGEETVSNVIRLYDKTHYKRKQLPIVISLRNTPIDDFNF